MISESLYIPWLTGIAIVLVLIWLAWRRPNRKRLPWRILASVIAGMSLVLLAFPPAFEKQIDPGSAIVLTQGYNQDTLTALLQNSEAAPLVYSYRSESSEAEPVSNLYALLQEQPQLQTIHLLGYGLEPQELEALKPLHVIPHMAAQPAGMSGLFWPATIRLGDAVEVAGQFNTPADEATTLYLLAAGKLQDSVQFKEKGLHSFRLSFIPKREGQSVYQVLARSDNQTDTLGQVPVQVLPSKRMSVLLLSSAPLFEFRFLKNHLGELQHQVALRSTVSKGINQSEWINMPQTNLSRITPDLLEKFDVVITEPQALQDMSQAERASLQRAVTQNGLGVLTIRGEQNPNRATSFFTDFTARRVTQQDTRSTHALWASNYQAAATALPYALLSDETITGLIQDRENGFLAAAKKEGWGTIALSMIPQTFSWQLEGKEKIYDSYWAYLLSEIAKKEVQEKFWQLKSPQVPKQDSPVTFTYTDYTNGNAQETPEALVRSITDTAGIALALQQDQYLPEQFNATFWPKRTGWHIIETPGAPDFHFLVQNSADWQHETVQLKRRATMVFAAQQDVHAGVNRIATIGEQVPIFWFFFLFVLSSGFLWMEEKL